MQNKRSTVTAVVLFATELGVPSPLRQILWTFGFRHLLGDELDGHVCIVSDADSWFQHSAHACLPRGLAMEAMITLLTPAFAPFFLVLWIIGQWSSILMIGRLVLIKTRFSLANVSVCFYPIDLLPPVFRYGYAAPFYNVSRTVRTILFNTKNQSKRSQRSTAASNSTHRFSWSQFRRPVCLDRYIVHYHHNFPDHEAATRSQNLWSQTSTIDSRKGGRNGRVTEAFDLACSLTKGLAWLQSFPYFLSPSCLLLVYNIVGSLRALSTQDR